MVQRLAEAQQLFAVLVSDDGDDSMASRSDWVLLSDNAASLQASQIASAVSPIDARSDWSAWTDDFNNIVQVIK